MDRQMHDSLRGKIVGDVTSTADVKVDGVGKNASAKLPLHILGSIKAPVAGLLGATFRFDDGQSVVIVSTKDPGAEPLSVRKVSGDLFEISRGPARTVEVDDVEAAFLQLKVGQFSGGKLELGSPQNAGQWSKSMQERLASARRTMENARSRATA